MDDVDSNEYTNTLSDDFPSWGDKYSGAAYEYFGGWGVTRGLIKNWRWLARLVEKLTHRGLIYYGVYLIVIISRLIMCDDYDIDARLAAESASMGALQPSILDERLELRFCTGRS